MILLKYTVPLLLWTCCNSQNVCEEPPEIDFGATVSDGKIEYRNGDRVQYRCFPGYASEGPEWITCKGPEWTPAPKCLAPCTITKQQLQAKNLFLSGGQRHSRAVGNNQTLEFLCKEGYVLSAPSIRRCIDGHMNLPSCISERGKNCSRSPTIENGDITTLSLEQYTSGSSVEFKCQRHYAMEGHNRSFCDNGSWTKVPVCLEPCVISLAEVERHNVSVKLRSNEDEFQTMYLPHGDSIEFHCKSGHVLATNPSQSVFEFQCTGGPIVYPECKEVVCSRPEVDNGRVSPHRQQYSYEETIQIQCDSGYEPEQQRATSNCTKNGWQPQPKCVSKRCDYPEEEVIEVYGYSQKYSYYLFPRREGTSIDFRCKDGFLPANKQTWQRSMCTKFGWNPEPKCFKQCEHTRGFPHGNFIYNRGNKFIAGNEISFSCDTGYYPEQQEAKAKCTKNGWSPTPRCIFGEIPTCKRNLPLNGFFADQKDQFALNERTRYRCQIGFTTREGLEEGETQCLREGWTPKPECIQTCQKPIGGNVIISISRPVFLLEENLPYKCEDGYETIHKALEDNSECTVNGWSPRPQCQPIQCEGLLLDNGDVHPRKGQYFYNDIVRFSCRSGHVRVGPISAQCYHFGWSPPPPICKVEERTCGPPPFSHSGISTRSHSRQYFHGETVRYECTKGSVVVGSNSAKCLHGQWDLPSCADGCAPPEIPENTNHGTLKKRYRNDEVFSYACDSIQRTTTCVNGNWSPRPDCRGFCPPPPQLPNATEIIEVRNYENGEKIQFTCKEHFLLEGQEEILCEDGKWEKPPQCIDASCGNPPSIANGGPLNGTRGRYLPGTKMDYYCNEGFDIIRRLSTCRNRSWTPGSTCKEKPCGSPPQVFDASLVKRVKKSYAPGETVDYVCHPGFAADGPLAVTCRKGQWTEPPTCEEAVCGDPPTVANADIISGRSAVYKSDHQVQYGCRKGFEMSGSDTVTCEFKMWSEPPTCEDITCPPPNEIHHGRIAGQRKERYMHLDTVHYQCDPDWTLSGPVVVTCFRKQWTNLPRCIDDERNCGRPPVIQNGDVLNPVQGRNPPGTTLQYKCQNLYLMNGTSEVRCENGLWTEPPVCIEACTVSEEDMARNNIQLRWRDAPKIYSASGGVVEFMCRQYYRLARSSPPFRTQCINGRLEYPRCINDY